MKVLSFVGTRADLYPLGPVLAELSERDSVELHICTAIGFDAVTAEANIEGAGLRGLTFTHHHLCDFEGPTDAYHQSRAGAQLAASMTELVREISPDVAIVLGDRWELLYATPPLVMAGVRLVHVHGGEVTEGAFDDRVRHAITKLSDQHCVSTAGADARVSQLGETDDRIHLTGAPGLDRFNGVVPFSDAEFRESFGHELVRPLALVTFHPPTSEAGLPIAHYARQLLEAAVEMTGTSVITYPGYDAGRDDIIGEIQRISAARPDRVIVRENLGPLYPRLLSTADIVIGNSSSGVLEAASFHVPVVNIGQRQSGRESAGNVLDCDHDDEAIAVSIGRALSAEFLETSRRATNPYGDGQAASRIADVVCAAAGAPLTKVFKDMQHERNGR